MSEIVMLEGHESQAVLQTVVDSRAPAIMSYLSKDKWHVAKVLMKELVGDRLLVEGCHSAKKPHPINIRVDQPVGVNFKHAYGKFVFDTTVVGLEPSADASCGGTIVLAIPHRIGVVQRRSYFRVSVPESLRVNVVLWHRTTNRSSKETAHKYYEGRLTDISAGGAQLVVPLTGHSAGDASIAKEADFHKGQFVGMRFTPMPYEMPLMFNAQIRNVLPTADHQHLCLGLQIVGLEASDEGRQTLSRLAAVVDRYYQINQSHGNDQQADPAYRLEASTFHVSTGTPR
ncbi:MAG: PilZ domain-containing protein [Sedimentisphaerales bacterium]|nr:PilZ domain-containing protein [Sedimentisphaerales bacterium]